MKVYIAARARNRVAEVNKIQKALRELGHTITYDWAATNTSVKKPYRNSENREHNMQAVPKMLKAAAEAQVFILMDEPGMRGAYVELGAFLAKAIEGRDDRRVYIVGPDSRIREHVFESPDYVYFMNDIDSVYTNLARI